MATISLQELHAQGPFLKRLARALVRDEAAAEDLVQETWVVALRSPTGPREDEEPRGWLARLLRNRARSARRGAARRRARELVAGAARAEARSDARVASGAAIAERVLGAVLKLEEPYKTLVLQRYYQDLTPTRIARMTGTPLKTVESRLRRAREELRARLDGEYSEHGGRAAWCVALGVAVGFERSAPLAGALVIGAWAAGIAGALLLGWTLSNLGGPEGPVDVSLVAPRAASDAPEPTATNAGELIEPADPILARDMPTQEAVLDTPAEVASILYAMDEPVARIEGRVVAGPDNAPWVAAVPYARGGVVAGEPIVASCEAGGAFALSVPLAQGESFGLVERVRLIAVARGVVPRTRVLAVARDAVLFEEMVLDDVGAVAAGIAVDADGAPLPGATVEILAVDAEGVPLPGTILPITGRESFSGLEVGPYTLLGLGHAKARVEVTADRFGRFEAYGLGAWRHRVVVIPRTADGLLTVRLDAGESGQVVSLPNAEIVAKSTLSERLVLVEGPAGPLDGVSLLRGASDGISIPRLKAALEEWKLDPAKHHGSLQIWNLPADGRARLLGDASSGLQVAFARAGFDAATLTLKRARADADGWVHFALVPLADRPSVVVSVHAAEGAERELPADLAVLLAPAADERSPFAVRFERALAPGASEVRIEDVPAGAYDVVVTPPAFQDGGWIAGRGVVRVAAEGESRVDVELPRGAVLHLWSASDGADLAGVEVRVVERGRRALGAPETLRLTPRPGAALAAGTPGMPGGSIRLYPAVPAGRFDASLVKDGAVVWTREVTLEAGKDVELVLAASADGAAPGD